MPREGKSRLYRAQRSIASWFVGTRGTAAVRSISTPQLIKRPVHVTYDQATGTFQGVPTVWRVEFDKGIGPEVATTVSAAAAVSCPTLAPEDQMENQESTKEANGGVWFDQCNRRFVNLPAHWRERLQRNNLTEWPEFQQNPEMLTEVFTMMDEELKCMDLAPLGLDSTIYSSPNPNGFSERQDAINCAKSERSTADEAAAAAAASSASASTSSRAAAQSARRPPSIVWTQQRSFVKDDDTDSEEIAEL